MFRRAFVHVAFCRGNFGNEHLGVAGPYDWLHHGPRQDGFPWLFSRQPPRESAGGDKPDGCKEDKRLLAVDGVIEALCRSVMNVPRRIGSRKYHYVLADCREYRASFMMPTWPTRHVLLCCLPCSLQFCFPVGSGFYSGFRCRFRFR